MKVVVTGGAGFIGSHIVDLLIEQGSEVAVIDNLSTGDLAHVHQQATLFQTDIVGEQLDEIFQQYRPEAVIHQAAQVDVPKSMREPLSDGFVNVMGTLNVLESAKRYGVKKIVYASSCAVYGEPLENPITEQHRIDPISLYGASKWLGECYIRTYHRIHQLDYTILRYANVYGPRQGEKGEGGVVSIFLRNLMEGVSPTIFGDGKQTRDFVYVKDVARANVLAVRQGSQQTVNVSTNVSTSIESLYEQLKYHTRIDLPVVYKQARPGDIQHSLLNASRSKQHLGWEPRYSLQKGIAETVQYLLKGKERSA